MAVPTNNLSLSVPTADAIVATKVAWELQTMELALHFIACSQGCPERSCDAGVALRESEQATWRSYHDARALAGSLP